MVKINWDEYKIYKASSNKDDNFEILLDFIKSYYNMIGIFDIYDVLITDELAKMMLEKREIKDAHDLEKYMYKAYNG